MSLDSVHDFKKRDIDRYLYEFAKEYKRLGGRHSPVEIILVGGAAIMENYSFREMTRDIDAILPSASIVKEAIDHVSNKYALPAGWLNDDFARTKSYSPKLFLYSVPCRTINQVVNIRTINAEYLIAMKLMSARDYKNDLSDVAGILNEHKANGKEITYAMVDTAVRNLYGDWNDIPRQAIDFLKDLMKSKDLNTSYDKIRRGEEETRKKLIEFEKDFPGVLSEKNLKVIENSEKRTNSRASVLARLKAYAKEANKETSSRAAQKKEFPER